MGPGSPRSLPTSFPAPISVLVVPPLIRSAAYFGLNLVPPNQGMLSIGLNFLIHVKFRKGGWGFVSFDFFFSLINDGCVKVIESF